MPQPPHITRLALTEPDPPEDDIATYYAKCQEKLGLVPHVLRAYAHSPAKLRTFMSMYNQLMLGESDLSKVEREMIAVVVSSANRCYYCLVAHGQALRAMSRDPQLGEMLVMNYRVAPLPDKQRAMLDVAWQLTVDPHSMAEDTRQRLRDVGWSEAAIFDIFDVAAFFNYTNRVAHGTDMMPNPDYHAMNR